VKRDAGSLALRPAKVFHRNCRPRRMGDHSRPGLKKGSGYWKPSVGFWPVLGTSKARASVGLAWDRSVWHRSFVFQKRCLTSPNLAKLGVWRLPQYSWCGHGACRRAHLLISAAGLNHPGPALQDWYRGRPPPGSPLWCSRPPPLAPMDRNTVLGTARVHYCASA